MLDENSNPPLQLVQGAYALWSLTFGIAQVDDSKSEFVRTLKLRDDLRLNFPFIKLAEAVISIMRQMFPLPVALISTIAPTPSSPSLHESVLQDLEKLLKSIAPFCLWSMRSQDQAFEISVHIRKGDDSTKPRVIKFVLEGVVGDTRELQNTISNRLHQEYGIPSIAFAEAPYEINEEKAATDSKASAEVNAAAEASGNESTEPRPTISAQETGIDHFLRVIRSCCLQSTKVLLKIADKPPSTPAKEVFLLEQVLNDFSVYREVVADFFLALKDELQQRIHGEDADELCRTTYEQIKRSSPVSLPLFFFQMQAKSLQRLVKYLPDFFLRSNHVAEAESSVVRLGFIQQESASIIVQQYEHDYDFPVFDGNEREEVRQQAWTTYFEYLYLNCGDDRPYSPCWDPIALQEKAADVFSIISRTGKNLWKNKLTDVYNSFRFAVFENLNRKIRKGDNEYTIWEKIQIKKSYTPHDAIVLMNRLECGLKKVFYFLFCCKSIVFCEGCMEHFGFKSGCVKKFGFKHEQGVENAYALKCSNHGSAFCHKGSDSDATRSVHANLRYPSHKGPIQARSPIVKNSLKEFSFNWYIKVGLNLKKACSTALLRQHALLEDADKEKRIHNRINFSYSRDKLGVPKMQNDERSKLRNTFSDIVEHCRSGSLILQEVHNEKQSQILGLITMADCVNRVVAECDLLKTGCSVYERFPNIGSSLSTVVSLEPAAVGLQVVVKSAPAQRRESTNAQAVACETATPPTHLIVAAIEGNAAKASAYIARADLDYISYLCVNTNNYDARKFGIFPIASCALHLALERGNTDVANVIISRIHTLACQEYFDTWYPEPTRAKEIFIDRLFIGTSPESTAQSVNTDNNQEVPTNFMYLARYSMISAMDTVLDILRHLKKAEEMQTDISKYIIQQYDSNGLNALHYAVLSQSPQCVSWFLPYMHSFHVCHSTSKFTFCPGLFGNGEHGGDFKMVTSNNEDAKYSFEFGYLQFLRMHPPLDFADSDCRLSVSEDWIQTYHFSDGGGTLGLLGNTDNKCDGHDSFGIRSDEGVDSRKHHELSPYELSLLVWRLADHESTLLQEQLHNIATNLKDKSYKSAQKASHMSKHKDDSSGSSKRDHARNPIPKNNVVPIPIEKKKVKIVKIHASKSSKSARECDCFGCKDLEYEYDQVGADTGADSKEADETQPEREDEDEAQPERLAESYKQRSAALYKILTNLEEAAEAEVDIDAKKKKGLKQLAAYRNHRAMSRLVFPGMSYLIYVFFATLMAIIMTNGLFDEPAKFTHAVVAELGGAVKISNYNDLTVFWKTLAGFLWGSSPMALRFGEERNVCPRVLFAFHSL